MMMKFTALFLIGCVALVSSQIIDVNNMDMNLKATTQAPDACQLEKDAGPCKALFWRYYYDPATNSCVQFAYGGCYGNENNFINLKECQTVCMGGNP